MRFAILMNDQPGQWDALPPEEQARVFDQHRAFRAELEREGAFVDVLHLAPPSKAHTVERDAAGDTAVAEGMATGGREHLGGLYVIDVADEAAAIEWARRGRFLPGTNVVRLVFDD